MPGPELAEQAETSGPIGAFRAGGRTADSNGMPGPRPTRRTLKAGIKNKRLNAGWDEYDLEKVLVGS